MRRLLTIVTVACLLGAFPVNLWAQANLPNNPNAATVEGPDPSGMLGYPLATVPATGALAWPVSGSVSLAGSSVVSALNSSTATLLAGQTFTGTFEDVSAYSYISVLTSSNVAGALGLSPVVQWSMDGVSVDQTEAVSLTATYIGFVGGGHTFNAAVRARFFRLVYTNGAANQTTFRLQTILHASGSAFSAETGTYDPFQFVYRPIPSFGLSDSIIGANTPAIITAANLLATVNGGTQQRVNCIALVNSHSGLTQSTIALETVAITGKLDLSSGNSNDCQLDRTVNRFSVASTAAVGNTALITPAAGKKFRLMRWRYTVTESATTAGGADLVIQLFDGAAGITGQKDTVTVPAIALATSGQLASSPWIDLGNGYLSTAANNALNINLSAALTAGTVTVQAVGTEE